MSQVQRQGRAHTRWLAILAVLGLLAAACGGGDGDDAQSNSDDGGTPASAGEPTRGGELKVSQGVFHEGWDPDAALEMSSIQYIQHVMEPLIRASADGETLEPGLAESWEYDEDALTFTFTLQPGAAFSDGTPVTTADIEFSVEQWLAGPAYGIIYESIESVEIIDDQNAVFHLAYADSSLATMLSWQSAAVMPKDFGGRTRDEYMANPIGAGPFAIESWSPNAELILVRNESYYHPERPYLDKIVISENSDLNQRMVAYESGDADLIVVPPDQMGSIPDDKLVVAPAHLLTYLGFNTTAAPLDDPVLRKGIALAIDFESLQGLGNGVYELPNGGIPPNIADWAPPSEPYFSRDVEQAKALIAEAGAEGLALELTYDTGNFNHDLVAQLIQSSLAEVGIDVTIVGLDTNSHLERAGSLDYDIDLWTMSAISPTAIDPVGYYLAVDYLYTGYPLDTLDTAFGDFISVDDDAAQQAAIAMVQDEILNEVPFVALFNSSIAYAVSSDVQGFAPAPWQGWWFDQIWLDQ